MEEEEEFDRKYIFIKGLKGEGEGLGNTFLVQLKTNPTKVPI